METKKLTVQDWNEIENVFNNGVIRLKNNQYIKILKISPINFNLKSDLEKQSILNSYKIFLKTCNFDFQILIQSNKEDLQKNIDNVEKNLKEENKYFLNDIGNDYFDFINKINSLKTSATKDFYIIISNNISENIVEELIFEELNDKFLKVKECLQRCGNFVKNLNTKDEVERILFSFYNTRLFFS